MVLHLRIMEISPIWSLAAFSPICTPKAKALGQSRTSNAVLLFRAFDGAFLAYRSDDGVVGGDKDEAAGGDLRASEGKACECTSASECREQQILPRARPSP